MGRAQPIVDDTIPELVVLGSIRKQAGASHRKQASKQFFSMASAPCLQDPALLEFLSWLPSVIRKCKPNKSFSLFKISIIVFHHTNSDLIYDMHVFQCWEFSWHASGGQKTTPVLNSHVVWDTVFKLCTSLARFQTSEGSSLTGVHLDFRCMILCHYT